MYKYKNPEFNILETMTIYGGSFVKQLAMLYRLADATNQIKLEETFRNYFMQYDDMASIKTNKETK